MGEKNSIIGFPLPKLQAEMKALRQPAFRAKQIFSWIHQKNCASFEEMTDLSKDLRRMLDDGFVIESLKAEKIQKSDLDGTVKLLLRLFDGNCVETVLMRYHHGNTVCVSSQVGCRMGCEFCASAPGGLIRNLSAGEMVAQIVAAEKASDAHVSNVVLMGIGEPLDNFDNVMDFISVITDENGRNMSARNISLSTCGVVPAIEKLATYKLPLTLSISLHATDDETRSRLMPVNKAWPLKELMKACKDYRRITKRRISYEYAVIHGENDGDKEADALAELLKGTDGHVNLIPINPVKTSDFSESKRTKDFAQRLQRQGVQVTVRRRLGADIDAACGQLRMNNIDEFAENKKED